MADLARAVDMILCYMADLARAAAMILCYMADLARAVDMILCYMADLARAVAMMLIKHVLCAAATQHRTGNLRVEGRGRRPHTP